MDIVCLVIFFFQAEDGIRDTSVTGVQTCALPIYKALRFYTEILGFVTKADIPMGEARWITVVSPEDTNGTELVLEPDGHPRSEERRVGKESRYRSVRFTTLLNIVILNGRLSIL